MTTADDYVIQIALQRGLLQRGRLDEVREKFARHAEIGGSALLEGLIADGVLEREILAQALADEFGMPYVTLRKRQIDPEVWAAIPGSFIREHGVVPFARENGVLQVALADPIAVDVTDSLTHMAGTSVRPALASADDIREVIARYCPTDPFEEDRKRSEEGAGDASQLEMGQELAGKGDEEGQVNLSDAPVINLVRSIIVEGARRRASDIHLEPLERRFRVRYRIDGVLLEVEAPPKHLQPAIISRVKIMANISIAEKRVPQDGRLQIVTDGKTLDLRVSSLPTVHGESIVMRILDQGGLKLGLAELGFLADDRQTIERQIGSPDGLMLVTGPTGSGKTTTLYSCLHGLNQPGRKIITVEDPVEYQLAGINQVPVNGAIGMTFASALRAMLRQTPNIVMVGEIRDRETAEIAINAALTGHMVFSTLHTNDAPSAVTRLVDIGAKPFLVAAALRASVAQRLVRRNCPHCLRAYTPSVSEFHALGLKPDQLDGASFAHGTGCPACLGTGYLGRFGIFEIFLVNDAIRAMIYDRASASRLRQRARQDGLLTMREDGLRKVLAGLTTIEEVVSVTLDEEPAQPFNQPIA